MDLFHSFLLLFGCLSLLLLSLPTQVLFLYFILYFFQLYNIVLVLEFRKMVTITLYTRQVLFLSSCIPFGKPSQL